MKSVRWAALLLVLTALAAGCKGFWDPPTSSGGTTTTTTNLSSGHFYILDSTTSQIVSYYINAGALTLVGTVAVPTGSIAITVAPNDDFLYVSTLQGIYLYTISNGVLTEGNSSQPITNDPAVAMQVDSTNSWLVETSGTGTLNAVPLINTGSAIGQLNSARGDCPGQSVVSIVCSVPLTGSTVHQLAISPNNLYIFAACATNGTEAFGFDDTSGGSPFGSGAYDTITPVTNGAGAALSLAVDPSNRVLYVGEADAVSSNGGLRVFTIGTNGALAEISGSPYASGGAGPHAILPIADGDDVYVANWTGSTTAGNIAGFSISDTNSTFSLTPFSKTVATGAEPNALAQDSDGNFVLAVNAGGSPGFEAYYFDTTTAGQLDTTITSSSYAGTALAANH